MKVLHKLDNFNISNNVDNPSFLLTNKAGSYVSLAEKAISRYQGVFFFENLEMYKVIEGIRLVDAPKVAKLVNKFWSVEREFDKVKEMFFMPFNLNSLVYELNSAQEINLILDCRKSYDTNNRGRNYEVSEEKGCIVIKCTKPGIKDLYLVVSPEKLEYATVGEEENVSYEFDKKRNSQPFEATVYNALRIKSRRIIFSFGTDKDKALKEAGYVKKNLIKLKKEHEEYTKKNLNLKKIKNKEIYTAYLCAINSLDNFTTEDGVLAGLYWFFQYWARDEAISLKALMLQKRYDTVKKILFRQLDNIASDGRSYSIFPESGLKSADGVGWMFKRIDDLIEEYHGLLNKKEIKKKLSESMSRLLKFHSNNGLITNDKNETWMDTGYGGDDREGARIEIQALTLAMYKLMRKLCRADSEEYKDIEMQEKELLKEVREKFWNGTMLADGLDDFTVRPNVFLAYYVYPELLTKEEWKTCFKTILLNLWNDWGGLSSIDKNNKLYCDVHTGENNKSYHRGDSWYFLNNLAAIALYKVDKEEFREYIDKIVKASTDEILWHGIVGSNSEISSSSKQESMGCLSQAWSNALYIELISEIYL